MLLLLKGSWDVMKKAEVTAYAKINLVLDVLGKREDGYHEVSMVMQAIDLADTILLEEAPRNWLITDNKYIPPNMNNLAMKAVTLMQKQFPQVSPLQVTLQKRIPVAAGLAGGSTDCAGVMLGINKMFQLGLSLSELEILGAELGSDVPFCLGGPTALATGRGEQIQLLPECPPLFFVLVKPSFGISTPKVYGNLRLDLIKRHPKVQQCIQGIEAGKTEQILNSLGNLLEYSTFRLQPNVEKLKRSMEACGCHHVLMSGSGPTVFAAFKKEQRAQAYYQKLKQQYPSAILASTVEQTMLEERVKVYDNE